jgi:hypothetical protein
MLVADDADRRQELVCWTESTSAYTAPVHTVKWLMRRQGSDGDPSA